MNIKKIITAIVTVSIAVVMSGCSKKTVTYNTEDYVSVSVSGLNGKGYLVTSSGTDEFFQKVNKDLFKGEASEVDLTAMMVNIAYYADYSVDGSKENLSNGDNVTIKMTADNESLRELGLEFALNDYVYTVSGLDEPTELDVWSGVDVTFEGISPNGTATVTYNGNNDFVRDNVSFYAQDAYSLANGGTVTVTASCDPLVLENNLYMITETDKEFPVEGLAYYPSDLNGFDLSDIDETLLGLAKGQMDNSTYMDAYNSGSRVYGNKIFRNGNVSQEWSITDEYSIKPVLRYMLADSADSPKKNVYTVFFEVTIPLEKTYTDKWAASVDGYSEGDTYDLVLYIESHMSTICVKEDVLDTSSAQTGSTAYGSSMFGNYLEMSLDEITAEYDSYYSDWIKTEIK